MVRGGERREAGGIWLGRETEKRRREEGRWHGDREGVIERHRHRQGTQWGKEWHGRRKLAEGTPCMVIGNQAAWGKKAGMLHIGAEGYTHNTIRQHRNRRTMLP